MKNVSLKFFTLITIVSTLSVLCSTCFSIVILVHGTFATSEPWARPGGSFFDTLEASARTHLHHLIPFAWNGGNYHKDRLQGAQALAKVIISYPHNEKKIVVGHSHGATVIILASHLLSDPLKQMCAQNKTHSELIKELVEFLNTQYTLLCALSPNLTRTPPSSTEIIETKLQLFAAYLDLHQELKKKKTLTQTRDLTTSNDDSFLIDRVYCLAAPIDPILYKPSMNIINHLFSFYSTGDVFQTGFGYYLRLFPKQDRVVNFKITIDQKKWLASINPLHWELHAPIIARYLLDIPYEFQKQKLFGFENYDENYNGEIHFDNAGPHYSVDKKTPEEREKEESNSEKKNYVT